jgi:hypothetical protein
MSTVGELIDRVYRDYLEAPDDQPVVVTVTAPVTATATEVSYDDSVLAPDEEDLLAPGVLAEIGTELVRITEVDPETNALTVTRGVNGTVPAAISANAEMTLAPLFPRQTVFDAVADNVVALYPDLARVETTTITAASSPVAIPGEMLAIRSAVRLSSSTVVPVAVELLRSYPLSATGIAVQFTGRVPTGESVYLTYETTFDRPTVETDDLADFGVEPAWERIVVVGAAAQVIAGRSIEQFSAEFITEQLEREGLPVGAPQQVRDGLVRYHRFLLDQARRGSRAGRTTMVVLHQ